MSKFEPGQRVSFLYFGEKTKGKITMCPTVEGGYFCIMMDDHKHAHSTKENMKKLKPSKPRREFWVVAPTDAVNTVVIGTSLEIVQKVIGTDDEREIIHVKEVK